MQLLGECLHKLREGLNMTQVQIGEILGIPQTSIHSYENGSYTPTAETLVWYADYFDVSLDYIFGRTDQPQGKLYDCKPEVLKLKEEQPGRWSGSSKCASIRRPKRAGRSRR